MWDNYIIKLKEEM